MIDFDLVVIGGGAGGLVAAAGGAKLGARVALVERDRLGGDCLWHGCVPSKALVRAARVAHEMRAAGRYGLTAADPRPDLAQVMAHVRDVVAGIAPHDSPERFRGLGVDVIFGNGRFVSPHAFEVDGRTLTARAFVIATGSRPAIPSLPGLDTVPYLTNETLFDVRGPIASLAVVGAGPVGCELAQALARLGTRVTLVDTAPRVLPHEDADLAAVVQEALASDGIDLRLGHAVDSVGARDGAIETVLHESGARATSAVRVTHLLLAAGRVPNVEDLGLDAAGVTLRNGHLAVDAHLRTSAKHIYAIGDVTGGAQFTHVAEHQAGVVLRQALFRFFWTRPSAVVPWCTFTDPELAQVGTSEAQAQAQQLAHQVWRFPFAELDRARTDGDLRGFAKLVTARDGTLLGAGIVGAHAGELVAELTLAIARGLRAKDLADVIHAYPTLASIARRVADERMKASLTPRARRWLQRVFRLRGA